MEERDFEDFNFSGKKKVLFLNEDFHGFSELPSLEIFYHNGYKNRVSLLCESAHDFSLYFADGIFCHNKSRKMVSHQYALFCDYLMKLFLWTFSNSVHKNKIFLQCESFRGSSMNYVGETFSHK